jgi:hypothetical protein
VIRDLRVVTLASLLIALLTVVASLAGLLFQDELYPTQELQESFVANDVVNLALGLPILLGSLWLARHGRLVGLLFWPGALFYGLYNYLVYLLALPLNGLYVLALLIVSLSIYTLAGLLATIDSGAVKEQLQGRVPEKLAGAILTVFGLLFMLLAISGIAGGLANGATSSRPELALQTTDFIVCFAWIIGGLFLWRRQALGYVSGTGLLFQASMLFIGLIAILLLKPLLDGSPLAVADILITMTMSLVSFVPLGLFVRGLLRAESGARQARWQQPRRHAFPD